MPMIRVFLITAFVVSVTLLAACGTKQPTAELKEAQASVMEAQAAGAEACAPELYSMAQSSLSSGQSQIADFTNELRAKRTLIDANAFAMEATLKCRAVSPMR